MVKVLIVGATGFLGKQIAMQAAKAGHQVTALVSQDSLAKKKQIVAELKAAGIDIATGSLESDQKDLVALMKTVDTVRPQERALALCWTLVFNIEYTDHGHCLVLAHNRKGYPIVDI